MLLKIAKSSRVRRRRSCSSPSWLLLGLVLATLPQLLSGIKLLDDIIHFKENLLNGIGGLFKGGENCGCPCRNYYIPKCEMSYVQQCHQDHYYNEVCESMPVYVTKKAKETECQKCRKYYETVPTTKWVKECNPVYDEKCHTKYQRHCSQTTRCVMLYQTVCSNSYDGYQQQCQNEPRQHCYPETKCHKTPQTQCTPVKKEHCVKVQVPDTKQVERSQCLPFDQTRAQLEALGAGNSCEAQGFQAIGHDGTFVAGGDGGYGGGGHGHGAAPGAVDSGYGFNHGTGHGHTSASGYAEPHSPTGHHGGGVGAPTGYAGVGGIGATGYGDGGGADIALAHHHDGGSGSGYSGVGGVGGGGGGANLALAHHGGGVGGDLGGAASGYGGGGSGIGLTHVRGSAETTGYGGFAPSSPSALGPSTGYTASGSGGGVLVHGDGGSALPPTSYGTKLPVNVLYSGTTGSSNAAEGLTGPGYSSEQVKSSGFSVNADDPYHRSDAKGQTQGDAILAEHHLEDEGADAELQKKRELENPFLKNIRRATTGLISEEGWRPIYSPYNRRKY